MRLTLTTVLEASLERVQAELLTPRLLDYVAAPLLRFKPLDPARLPDLWAEGRYRVGLRAFGILPLGRQWIVISMPAADAGSFALRDNGSGTLAKRWDHLITVAPTTRNATLYTDQVDIEAGVLTLFIWFYARIFYAHRQRRWRKLIAQDFAGTRRLAWRDRFAAELNAYEAARSTADIDRQWQALERAHILSQVSLLPHLKVHSLMLKLALQQRETREIMGQAYRFILAPLGTLTGRIPWGNTGRSSISAFTPMPIPADLLDVLRS